MGTKTAEVAKDPAATVTMAKKRSLRRSVCCKEALGREDRNIAYSCRAGSAARACHVGEML